DQARVPGRVSARASKGRQHKSLAGVVRQLHSDAARLAAGGQFKHGIERWPVVQHFAGDGKPAGLTHDAIEAGGLTAVTEEHIELQRGTRGRGQAKAEREQSRPKRRADAGRKGSEVSGFRFRTTDFDWDFKLHKPIS